MTKTATATADMVAQGEALKFIGHGDGGPTVIIPNAVLGKYTGAVDYDSGASHYEAVCDAGLVMPFEGHELLILQEEGSTAWVPEGSGGLLLRWVGAETGAALLAAVQGEAFAGDTIWTVPAGGLTFMHAVENGAEPADQREWSWTTIDLPAGRYLVEELADGEWNGSVALPTGHTEDVMMQCYRLRAVD